MARRFLAWLVLLAAAQWSAQAHACSYTEDHVSPSNFEMVQLAEAIAIATPVRAEGNLGLVFRVESRIKGTPPRTVSIGWAGFGPSSIGMCRRSGFERGRRYILFLGRDAEGRWDRIGYSGAADSPDYDGENGEWTRTIRRYHALQRELPPLEQLTALRRMVESGRDRDGRILSPAERFDIVDHLSAITPWKPTPWLLDLYARLERGDPLPFPPRPRGSYDAADLERAVRAFLAPAAATPREVQEEAELHVLHALALGEHRDALPLFERIVATPRLAAGKRGWSLRFLANHGRYDRAWQWIEASLVGEVARLPSDEARVLLRQVDDVQRGDAYEEGSERWRSHPPAVAGWPELALDLHWYQVRALRQADDRISFADAIAAIPISDYRARPELTLALAADYDEGVENWAIAELRRPTTPANYRDADGDEALVEGDEPDLLPLRSLVTAWSDDKEPVLIRAFCDGGERRRLLIHALGQWGDDMFVYLLERMGSVPDLSADERSWLFRAAVEMTARQIEENGSTGLLGADERDWQISQMARGSSAAPDGVLCPAP